jgi:glycosyltransferase involved in cell wall biosynthesis
MEERKISVVIPARNEENEIGRAIDSVFDTGYGNFEIVVVNDGSTDKTGGIVRSYMKKHSNVTLINFDEGHSAAFARNRGAEKADGEILVFLDADTIMNKHFLKEINKKGGKADGYIVVCLPMKTSFVSNALSGMIGRPFKLKLEDGLIYSKKNCDNAGKMFFVVSKKAFKKVGGYSEDTFYFEDEAFADEFYKAGFNSIFVRGAVQYFELPSDFGGFVRQCKWLGKGINTIKNSATRRKKKFIWFLKGIFLLLPLPFLYDLRLFFTFLLLTFGITYLLTSMRNQKPILSFVTTVFVYIKTFLVLFYSFLYSLNGSKLGKKGGNK